MPTALHDTLRPDPTVSALNGVFNSRYHSLAHYVLDAGSFVPDRDRPLLDCIAGIADWDATQVETVSDLIESLDGIPQIEPVTPEVAELNYLSLRYLARFLVRALEEESARIETILPETRAHLAAHTTLRHTTETLRKQAASVRGILGE
jgi:hypothetical protein